MSWRTCILLTLLAVVRGDYTSSPSGPGYTSAPVVNSPQPSQHTPPVTYSAPTPVPYTTAVVHTQPTTPTSPSGTTIFNHPNEGPYSSTVQNDIRDNSGYPYTWSPNSVQNSYNHPHQQLSPEFISRYYKQPPFVYPHSQQSPAQSQPLNPPAFQPHSCPSTNRHPYQPQLPYFQSNFQIPNPLSFLNGFPSPNSFHTVANPPGYRGPQPSPGYYSPNQPPSRLLFSVGYTSPVNRPLPYSVHEMSN